MTTKAEKQDACARVSDLLGRAKSELMDALVAAEAANLPTRQLWAIGGKLEEQEASFKERAKA